MSKIPDMQIEPQPDIGNLDTTGSAGNVKENQVAVFKNKLEAFKEAFSLADATIRTHRTVNIFSYNPEKKTGLGRFKQILDNIGHNIAVLCRGEGDVAKTEEDLNKQIEELNDTISKFTEGDYKEVFKNGNSNQYITTLENYQDQLNVLYRYSNRLEELYNISELKKNTIEIIKNNLKSWWNQVEKAAKNADIESIVKVLESFSKDEGTLRGIKDFSLPLSPNGIHQTMINFAVVADCIQKIRNDNMCVTTVGDILGAYCEVNGYVAIGDGLLNVISNDLSNLLNKTCTDAILKVTGNTWLNAISNGLSNLLDKTCTDAILKKSGKIKNLKEGIADADRDWNIDGLLNAAEQKCKTVNGQTTKGLETFFDNLRKVPKKLNDLDKDLRKLVENNEKSSANTFIGRREKFKETFKTENKKIQASLDEIQKQINNHPDEDTQEYLQKLFNEKKTHFAAIKDLNRLDDSIRKLNGDNDGVTFESVKQGMIKLNKDIQKLELSYQEKMNPLFSEIQKPFEAIIGKKALEISDNLLKIRKSDSSPSEKLEALKTQEEALEALTEGIDYIKMNNRVAYNTIVDCNELIKELNDKIMVDKIAEGNVANSFKEIQTEFSKFIKNLSQVPDLKQKERLLTKHYTDTVLRQMEQKFQKMDPTIRKAFGQNIYDSAKKETRDMYVNYLKGIK